MSKPIDPSQLPYRLGVGLVVVNRQGLVFAAQRIDTQGAWQMPQGGIDKGETPEQAALRELEEEIGTNKATIIGRTADWLTYDLPVDVIGKVWKGRYRGQKQVWFALRFTGQDSDINIATEHPEFSDWRWMPLDEVVARIVPFKRDLYAAAAAELARFAVPE